MILRAPYPDVAAAGGNFISDSFTETADTLIQNHAPELGGSYLAYNGGGTVVAATGRLTISAGSDSGGFNNAVPPSPSYSVEGILSSTSGITQLFIRATYSGSDINNGYFVFRNGNSFTLAKRTNGNYSSITSANLASVVGDAITLRAIGSTISVWVNSTMVLSVNDTSFAAAGRAAIGGNAGAAWTSWRAYT